MKRISIVFVVAALLVGCGDGDDSTSSSTGSSGASGAAGSSSTESTSTDSSSTDTSTEASTGSLSSDDESQIEDTAKSWLTEGDCDLMTDKFLEAQTFLDDPEEACKTFETTFTPPSYSADEITVTDIEGDGESATATIGDTLGSGVESTYKFKKDGDTWQIDEASF